ncbi:DUF4178 domain-containing protein [Myxococcota bacterium]|nr:DUF4178 domain-containing protein [Myxococcota bacterium]
MISASCPSCSAPVAFKHASALATICPSCESTVVRSGADVKSLGKVAKFARDLSPLQVGASGAVGKRRFEVIGAIRKGRPGVRWTEWYLAFSDGGVGWLAEANAMWELYDKPPVPAPGAAMADPDDKITVGDETWIVREREVARVLAAEGSLPFPVVGGEEGEYVDLWAPAEGLVGTLDAADDPPTLWRGQPVELADLKLEGVRAFEGWSDSVLVSRQGPEITGTRALRCPNCSGAITLRAPGAAQKIVCQYCSSELGIEDKGDASQAILIRDAEKRLWKPPIELGAKGELGGVPWQVIGAMGRSVTAYGQEYPWVEHLLFNPYRGYRYLVVADGHWSLVKPMPLPPRGARADAMTLRHGGDRFQHFQSGQAQVRKVVGEFTWEVSLGDMASTDDYVAPPKMLSVERTREETTWSEGVYLPHEEVWAAFGDKSNAEPGGRPKGVAPHQPNPYGAMAFTRAVVQGGVFFVAALALFVLSNLVTSNQRVAEATWSVDPVLSEQVMLTQEFTLSASKRRNLRLAVASTVKSEEGLVHAALLNLDTGEAYLIDDKGDQSYSSTLRDVSPGRYVARLELARPTGSTAITGRQVGLKVTRDPGSPLLIWIPLLFAPTSLLFYFFGRSAFETKRWANSDHAPES